MWEKWSKSSPSREYRGLKVSEEDWDVKTCKHPTRGLDVGERGVRGGGRGGIQEKRM